MRRPPRGVERVLVTLLFTDIVGSTELAARLGDRGWKQLLARHHQIIRRQLRHFRGREVDTAGDGFFATFERPAQAINCAWAARQALAEIDVTIRAGLHTGEAELIGAKLGGIAVHAASRILALARPGEVLVSAITHDLVAGSDIEFVERGTHELRGIPGDWRLYSVERAAVTPAAPAAEESVEAGRRRSRALAAAGLGTAAVVGGALAVAFVLAGSPPPPTIEARPNSIVRVDPASGRFLAGASINDPTEMTLDAGTLWVLSVGGRNLIKVDLATTHTDPVGLPGTPTGLAAAGGAVWITTGFGAASGTGAVVRVGMTSGSVEQSIPLGNGVDGIAAGEGAVWVTNRLANTLTRIDLTTLTPSTALDLGEQPEALAVGEGAVWVANTADRTIWRIDPRTLGWTELTLADTPSEIALGFGRLWVTSATGNSVTIFDVASNAQLRRLPLSGNPRGVSAGTDAMWLALSGAVVGIDPDDYEVKTRIDLSGVAHGVAADSPNSVWVSIRD